jgi:diguanylate cyclase (GGDEF)-like protein
MNAQNRRPVTAPIPSDESGRLSALERYGVLDTEPEPAFDRITAIASRVLGVPIALVSLVDSERQWFKSRVGLDAHETHRDFAFCAHAILKDAPLVVPDACHDQRFAENPLVVGAPHIRFYAGAPLQSPDGFKLGTLCAIDIRPRELSAEQLATLRDLAALVVDELELRATLRRQAMVQTALSVAEAKVREHFRMLNGIVEGAGEGIAVVDRNLRAVIVNPAGMAMLGLERFPSGTWNGFEGAVRPDGVTAFAPEELPLHRALRGENSDQIEMFLPRTEQRAPLWLSVTGRPLRDDAGTLSAGIVTFNDITKLRDAQRRAAELALTDELTSLPNRRAFRQLLARLVAEAARGRRFALVMVDIDHFKQINDSYGHQRGDDVLVAVAERLRRRVRRSDFVGRYGGEEFCILYTDVDEERALHLAEELRVSVATISEPRPITASFGVCAVLGEISEEKLISNADAALYRAKRDGRNRVCSRA